MYILVPVTMMSQYHSALRVGYLEEVFHIFSCSLLMFDPGTLYFEGKQFTQYNWSKFYPHVAESMPSKMPGPRGKFVLTSCFVDANHAGCRVMRQSQTGVLLYLQKALVIWYPKQKHVVKSSTFGSEFVIMKT